MTDVGPLGRLGLTILASLISGEQLAAQVSISRPLVVVTRNVPPFALPDGSGGWQGISVDLWRGIAERLELTYEFQPQESVDDALAAVAVGKADAAVGAFTITAQREQTVDFTHPFFVSGLGIAVLPENGGILASLIDGVFSVTFLTVVGTLALVLAAAGLLVWIFERKRNPEQFGGGTVRGLGEGFWWAAVTMTTVGYGDRAPQTLGGRFFALVWMFASIIVISGFTAGIATALTVQRLDTAIQGPADLPGRTVGTLGGSTSEEYLIRNRISTRQFSSVPAALRALEDQQVEAVVYDGALLRYHANSDFQGRVRVLPGTFEPQDYGIVLPSGSILRESVNQALLEVTDGEEWTRILHAYLGAE